MDATTTRDELNPLMSSSKASSDDTRPLPDQDLERSPRPLTTPPDLPYEFPPRPAGAGGRRNTIGSRKGSTPNVSFRPQSARMNSEDLEIFLDEEGGWEKFTRLRKDSPGWRRSVWNVWTSSWVNVLYIVVPFAWAAHFAKWGLKWTIILPFVALVPMAHQFEFLGEQMALYCGESLGDLVVITLNNVIEATLAIMLLKDCELRLAQATIAGVTLLHLLLVPGAAFFTGGAKIWYQQLAEHSSQLNQSLLAVGFLFMFIPTVFFSSLFEGNTLTDVGIIAANFTDSTPASGSGNTELGRRAVLGAAHMTKRVLGTVDLAGKLAVSDETRGVILQMSRGLAVMMLAIYVASRVYLYNPPGDKAARRAALAAMTLKEREELKEELSPMVNPWVGSALLLFLVAITAMTAEFLVDSLPQYAKKGYITEEWLGLILLPLTSFASDGLVAIVYFIKSQLVKDTPMPAEIAHGRSIDLSVQFLMFWMPLLVLVAWWISKPLSLLFDIFELAAIFGACFLVNYVTQDARTNWVEGFVMIVTYIMIAFVAWYYPSQLSHTDMMACETDVAVAIQENGVDGVFGVAEKRWLSAMF